MDTVYGMLSLGFLAGIFGGLLAGLGLRWGVIQRCTRLEWAVGDLQQRVSSMHGQKASRARWEKQTTLEEEFKALAPTAPATRRRYDNDPLGTE